MCYHLHLELSTCQTQASIFLIRYLEPYTLKIKKIKNLQNNLNPTVSVLYKYDCMICYMYQCAIELPCLQTDRNKETYMYCKLEMFADSNLCEFVVCRYFTLLKFKMSGLSKSKNCQ